jgi:hypothetical protein
LTQTRTQTHILDVTKHNKSRVGRPVLDHVTLHAEMFVLIESISPSDSLKDRNVCSVGFGKHILSWDWPGIHPVIGHTAHFM